MWYFFRAFWQLIPNQGLRFLSLLGLLASCSMGYVLSLDLENKADMSELILLIVSLSTLFIFAFTVSIFVFIFSNL